MEFFSSKSKEILEIFSTFFFKVSLHCGKSANSIVSEESPKCLRQAKRMSTYTAEVVKALSKIFSNAPQRFPVIQD